MSTKHPRDPSLSARAAFGRTTGVGGTRRFGLALALAFFAGASACSRAPERDPAQEDRTRLGALLVADAKVDSFLSDADRLDRQGRGEAAAALVEGEATTALREARALIGHASPETPWGRQRRAELDQLFADRAAAMPRYAHALRGADAEAKVQALVEQAALEKRALGIAAALRPAAPPPP